MQPSKFSFHYLIVLTLLATLVWLAPTQLLAGEATNQIRSTVEKVIDVLKDPSLATPDQLQERRNMLRKIIYFRFDFDKMAQDSLGISWRTFSPDQRTRFIVLFRQILEDAYLDKIESYQGETFRFIKEDQPNDQKVLVDSVITSKGRDYRLLYQMTSQNSDWKVEDVSIEGVSLVANYRSQFQQILQRSTTEELIVKLENKVNDASRLGRR